MGMNETIRDSLKALAYVHGVDASQLNDDTSDIIMAIAGADAYKTGVVVAGAPANTDFWGTKASEIQSDVAVANGAITGTLTKITSGALVEGWGEGYFLALKFTKANAKLTSIKAGMNPSVSSGLVELDEDMLGVFKITDKDDQRFETLATDGELEFASFYDLSGLTLSE
jgi:hypothetical protein